MRLVCLCYLTKDKRKAEVRLYKHGNGFSHVISRALDANRHRYCIGLVFYGTYIQFNEICPPSVVLCKSIGSKPAIRCEKGVLLQLQKNGKLRYDFVFAFSDK